MRETRACDWCGADVTRTPGNFRKTVFCSRRCAYDARRKDRPTTRRNIHWPDHPLAGSTGLVAEHRAVLYEKIGPGEHPCHWCGIPVVWTTRVMGTGNGILVVDHVDADGLNNEPTNLVPSCQPCNVRRAVWIPHGEPIYVRPDGKRRRGTEYACPTCGALFIRPPEHKPHKVRYCSRQCMYDRNR